MSTAIDYSQIVPEAKNIPGHFLADQEFKELTLPGGVRVGVAKGLLATWEIDEGMDRFHQGCFKKALAEHTSRDNRQIRFVDEHDRLFLMGGIPIASAIETDLGLEIEAHINLKHSRGGDVWELVKQRVIVDFSLGWWAIDWKMVGDIREIFEAGIIHGSTVGEPMNRGANILSFKGADSLPMAPPDTAWDAEGALSRVESGPFVSGAGLFKGIPFCDVIDGRLTVIPLALEALIPEAKGDPQATQALERYFSTARMASPFDRSERQFWTTEQVKSMTPRELEGVLTDSGRFSKGAAKALIARLDEPNEISNDLGIGELLSELRTARELFA